MTVTIEFNLPDERQDLARCLAVDDLVSALHDIREHLRGRLKYAELDAESRTELEAVRELLPFELMERLS